MDDSSTRRDLSCILYVQWRGNQWCDRPLHTGAVPGRCSVLCLPLVHAVFMQALTAYKPEGTMIVVYESVNVQNHEWNVSIDEYTQERRNQNGKQVTNQEKDSGRHRFFCFLKRGKDSGRGAESTACGRFLGDTGVCVGDGQTGSHRTVRRTVGGCQRRW